MNLSSSVSFFPCHYVIKETDVLGHPPGNVEYSGDLSGLLPPTIEAVGFFQ